MPETLGELIATSSREAPRLEPQDQPGLLDALDTSPIVGRTQAMDTRIPLQERVSDFLQSHARRGTTDWQEILPHAQRALPGIDHSQLIRPYEHVLNTEQARQRYERWVPNTWDIFTRTSVPGGAPAFVEQNWVNDANRRLREGNPEPGDYDILARSSRMAQLYERAGFPAQVARTVAGLPAIAGEAWLASGAVNAGAAALGRIPGVAAATGRAAAYAPLTTRALGAIGRVEATNLAMPSMTLPGAAERAAENGGTWNEMRNLGSAHAQGFLNTAILGSVQHFGGRGALGLVAKSALGVGEQAIADSLTAWMDTGLGRKHINYGTIGNALQGQWGELAQHATLQAITFTALGAMHHEWGRQNPVIESTQALLAEQQRQGMSRDRAMDYLTQAQAPVLEALRQNPNLTQPEAQAAAQTLPEGPQRRVAEAMAGALPVKMEKPAVERSLSDLATPGRPSPSRVESPMSPEQAAAALAAEQAKGPSRNRVEPRTPPAEPSTPFDSLSAAERGTLAAHFGSTATTPAGLMKAIEAWGKRTGVKPEKLKGMVDALLAAAKTPAEAPAAPPSPPAPPEPLRPPEAAAPPQAASPGLQEAKALLAKVDAGGVPGFVSSNLRRIAESVGVKIEGSDTPKAVVEKIRAAVQATEATPTPTPLQPQRPENAWRDTGTKFRDRPDGSLEFTGRNGETYHVQAAEGPAPENVRAKSDPNQRRVQVRIRDAEGREVGHVDFYSTPEGHWQEEGLGVEKRHRDTKERRTGVAAALYDFMAMNGQHVIPAEGRTPEGKRFWERNRQMGEKVAESVVPAVAQPPVPVEPPAPPVAPVRGKLGAKAAKPLTAKEQEKIAALVEKGTLTQAEADKMPPEMARLVLQRKVAETINLEPVHPELEDRVAQFADAAGLTLEERAVVTELLRHNGLRYAGSQIGVTQDPAANRARSALEKLKKVDPEFWKDVGKVQDIAEHASQLEENALAARSEGGKREGVVEKAAPDEQQTITDHLDNPADVESGPAVADIVLNHIQHAQRTGVKPEVVLRREMPGSLAHMTDGDVRELIALTLEMHRDEANLARTLGEQPASVRSKVDALLRNAPETDEVLAAREGSTPARTGQAPEGTPEAAGGGQGGEPADPSATTERSAAGGDELIVAEGGKARQQLRELLGGLFRVGDARGLETATNYLERSLPLGVVKDIAQEAIGILDAMGIERKPLGFEDRGFGSGSGNPSSQHINEQIEERIANILAPREAADVEAIGRAAGLSQPEVRRSIRQAAREGAEAARRDRETEAARGAETPGERSPSGGEFVNAAGDLVDPSGAVLFRSQSGGGRGIAFPEAPGMEQRRAGRLGGGQEGEVAQPQGRETALANAQVAIERESRGLPELPGENPVSDEAIRAAAVATLQRDPQAGYKLVDELSRGARPVTALENMVLLHHRTALANEHERSVLDYLTETKKPKAQQDQASLSSLDAQEQALTAQIDQADRITARTGSEAGRAFRLRRRMMAEDYTLSRMIGEAEKAKGSPLTAEEKSLIADLQAKIKDFQDKLAGMEGRGEVKPSTPSEVGFRLVQAKAKYDSHIEAWKRASAPWHVKGLSLLGEAVSLPRALMASIDFPLLRQGLIAAVTHPVQTAKAMPEMLRAFISEEAAQRSRYEVDHRPNSHLYEAAGLDLTRREGQLSQHEEGFLSRLIEKVPIVGQITKASERSYQTVLNRIRADSFDAMAATLSQGGKLTTAEAKVIANYVNVSTGRGNLGQFQQAATLLNHLFFAPKWAVSRFQYLLGQPLYSNFSESAPRARQLVAKEYARFAAGMGMIVGLAALAGFDMEKDPRSSDFGKLKVGNTRLDLTGGLASTARFLAQTMTLSTKNQRGQVMPLSGRLPYGMDNWADVAARFGRGKLAPAPGAVFNLLSGTDVVGQPVTPGSQAAQMVTPLYAKDVYDAMLDLGIPRGTAVSLLGLLGMGMNTHDANAPRTPLTPEEQRRNQEIRQRQRMGLVR